MYYTNDDFLYSLGRVNFDPKNISAVQAAYGNDDDGWSGGFIFCEQIKSSIIHSVFYKFYHCSGWCDYTGWGCQDGATLTEIKEWECSLFSSFPTEEQCLLLINKDRDGEKQISIEYTPKDLNLLIHNIHKFSELNWFDNYK